MENNLSNQMPRKESIIVFRNRITNWFRMNKRKYPWRETTDPFRILIAEVMLRRTKADQVKPVYERLFTEYPDVDALAEAEDGQLEEILYPLGLKWRTPAFGLIARDIKQKYQCKVPDERQELNNLPGVGEYVAGAVLCLAYGKKEWIVDSNIVRVFRRYFGIKTSKEGRRDKHVVEMAKQYASCRNPRNANLGLLDFAALVCTPRHPQCETCPLQTGCTSFRTDDAHK